MNNRNIGGNAGSSSNRSSLISNLRQMFNNNTANTGSSNTNTRVTNPVSTGNAGSNNSGQETVLTREVLSAVWARMQNLPSAQRTVLFNSLGGVNTQSESERSIEEDEEEEQITSRYRRRYHYYDEEAESQDEIVNPQEEEDYIDFRTYPLQIDWEEVENEKSDAYQICENFGYFGVAVFSSLSKLPKLKLTSTKFIKSIVGFYSGLILDNTEEKKNSNEHSITEFISLLPNLQMIKQLLYQRLINTKELTLIKIILDIYEHYLVNYDHPCYDQLKFEYLPTATLFYSSLTDEDVLYVYDRLTNKLKETSNILKNKLGGSIEKKRSSYIKHLKEIKSRFTQLSGGLDLSKFVI